MRSPCNSSGAWLEVCLCSWRNQYVEALGHSASSSQAGLCSELCLFADAHGEQKVSCLQVNLQICAWHVFCAGSRMLKLLVYLQVNAWEAPTNISAWKEEHVSLSASRYCLA